MMPTKRERMDGAPKHKYLGDQVHAAYDGGFVWLALEGGYDVIGLDEVVMERFLKFYYAQRKEEQ